jgi:hypothetical protein
MDNAQFAKRVASAAKAGWIAYLISLLIVCGYWALAVWGISTKPAWLVSLLGGSDSVTWQQLRGLWYSEFVVFDDFFIIALAVLIWLSLWARKLKKDA